MENKKIDLNTEARIIIFVDLLKRSKAALLNTRLRTIASSAETPEEARKTVLRKTGNRNMASATKLYAVALRDYNEDDVRGARKFLESNDFDSNLLLKHLKETHAPLNGDEALLKGRNDSVNNETG